MKSYDFIGIDEGCQTIFRADSGTGTLHWKISLEKYPKARAMQNLGEGNILVGFDGGYFIINSENGFIIDKCLGWKGITSVNRLDNGNTLLTGLDLVGLSGVCVITLDSHNKVINAVSRPGDYVRFLSLIPNKGYLLSTNESITETDENLKTTGSLKAEGFLHAWQSRRFDDGTTLISAGYGAFMALFDAGDRLIKKFGSRDEVPEEVNPFFYASFRIVPDGSILVANWQGHGPENGSKGRQLLRFSAEGKYLEGTSFPEEVSSLQGLLIL